MDDGSPALSDPLAEAADSLGDLRVRGCMGRSAAEREGLAEVLYHRLHPAIAALGVLFIVVVLAQSAARTGSALHWVLLALTWVLWATFAAEYLLRLVIAPSRSRFLRRTWWQLLFLAVPFLTMIRALLVLRVARPTRVAVAALRGGRSARASLTGRGAWIAVATAIVIFAAADTLYRSGAIAPYGEALHAAALAGMTGEPTGSDDGLAKVLDVVLSAYAVVVFAALAGITGAYFIEHRQEQRPPVLERGEERQPPHAPAAADRAHADR